MNQILTYITQKMREKGTNGKLLAPKLGLSYSQTRNILNGRTPMKVEQLMKIAEVLDLELIELLDPDYNSTARLNKIIDNQQFVIDAYQTTTQELHAKIANMERFIDTIRNTPQICHSRLSCDHKQKIEVPDFIGKSEKV